MKIIGLSVVVALGVLVVVGMGLTSHIFSYLEKHHFLVWQRLGSPSLLINNSAKNSWAFLQFIFSEGYGAIDDPKLARVCRVLRWCYLASFPLALVFLILLPFSG
ncbi:MAG: hypothetical protein IT510_09090 [Sulfuritalea sp.]|nr:hypothetical protein [Sulfuritalea sp.]